jgi:hypothetical protein
MSGKPWPPPIAFGLLAAMLRKRDVNANVDALLDPLSPDERIDALIAALGFAATEMIFAHAVVVSEVSHPGISQEKALEIGRERALAVVQFLALRWAGDDDTDGEADQ